MRQFNLLVVMALALVLSACGQAFEPAESPSADGLASAPLTGDPGDPGDPTDPNDPNPPGHPSDSTPNPAVKISTSLGSLAYKIQSQDSNGVTYSYDLSIPYGRVFKTASSIARVMTPNACRWVKGIKKETSQDYRDGEIPCGEIIGSNRKEIVRLNIPNYSDTHSGFKVAVDGFKLPVYMSRTARRGSYQESTLDQLGVQKLTSSAKFGDDISLRYVPGSDKARFDLCLNIPGIEVSAATTKIHAKASKKIIGIKLSYSSSFTVDPGQAVYDYGRGCFAANVNWTSAQTSPQIKLSATTKPYLQNVTYKGLHIKINDWFLRLVDKIVAFFRGSIRKEVTRTLVDKVNGLADRDVETGKWFSKTHAEDTLNQAGVRLTDRIHNAITRSGIPTSPDAVRRLLQDRCRVLKLSNSPKLTAKLQSLCRDHLGKIEIQVERFAVDAESKAAGCYSHYANIHKSKGKWWSEKCKFSTRFTARLPGSIQDLRQELADLLAEHLNVSAIPADWRKHLTSLDVDDYTLSLLLEELESRGYNQILPADWDRRIPAVLQDVRLKLLK